MYIIVPTSSYGQTLKKPFIQFICHAASFVTYLGKVEYSVELTYICIYVYSFELKISKHGCRMCNKS